MSGGPAGSPGAATLTSTDPLLAAFAAEVGEVGPISVAGRKTRWEVGGALVDGSRIVTAPTGIVDYSPDEMTVTVRAGTTVADLDEVLAERRQRTALTDRGGTVGGALAVGENDIHALGRGMIRTCLLQVRYISAEGRIISSGGPTVKNVSGFDLPRLIVGSLGTLGLLAEAIIRTNPIPPVSRWLKADDADPQVVFDTLLAPSVVLWDGTRTWTKLEGHGADVDAEQRSLARIGAFEVVDEGADQDWLPVSLPEYRWSLTPAEVLVADQDRRGSFVAVIGLGLLFAEQPQPTRTVAGAAQAVADRLKQSFDPTGRLNPGRNAANK